MPIYATVNVTQEDIHNNKALESWSMLAPRPSVDSHEDCFLPSHLEEVPRVPFGFCPYFIDGKTKTYPESLKPLAPGHTGSEKSSKGFLHFCLLIPRQYPMRKPGK